MVQFAYMSHKPLPATALASRTPPMGIAVNLSESNKNEFVFLRLRAERSLPVKANFMYFCSHSFISIFLKGRSVKGSAFLFVYT